MRVGSIRLDTPFGMPDLYSAPSFAAFFLVDVVFVCDFLPTTSGVDAFCVVDLNLDNGRKAGVGEGVI